MRKIILFQNVSLDGYFEGVNHDLSWSVHDYEAFETRDRNAPAGTLLFGHRTYDLMKEYWPTDEAKQMAPDLSKYMNETLKVVVSRKGFEPGWENVRVIAGDIVSGIKLLKEEPGGDFMIFGSNELVVSLMQANLIDEFQIVVNPVAIGNGTSLFAGLKQRMNLLLVGTRQFKSGAVMLTYQPSDQKTL